MLHTDMEMLYRIDSVDENGFVECRIGEGDHASDGSTACPVDSTVEPTVNKYIAVSNSVLLS